MLQIFITMFAIPHARAFENVATQEGYLIDITQPSQPERPSRKWPYLQNYADSVLLRLNGWNPSIIPSSVKNMLYDVFPSLACSSTRSTSPTPDFDNMLPNLSPKSQFPLSPSPYHEPPLHETLLSLTISDSSSSHSGMSSSLSGTEVSDHTLSSLLCHAQNQLERLKSEQTQLQEEVSMLAGRLQLTNDQVDKCQHTIEDLLQQLNSGNRRPSYDNQPLERVAAISHSFGKRTAALFEKWHFGSVADDLLFKIVSYSQAEADWQGFLRTSFNLSESQHKELFHAMREDYIVTQLKHASQDLQQ